MLIKPELGGGCGTQTSVFIKALQVIPAFREGWEPLNFNHYLRVSGLTFLLKDWVCLTVVLPIFSFPFYRNTNPIYCVLLNYLKNTGIYFFQHSAPTIRMWPLNIRIIFNSLILSIWIFKNWKRRFCCCFCLICSIFLQDHQFLLCEISIIFPSCLLSPAYFICVLHPYILSFYFFKPILHICVKEEEFFLHASRLFLLA